MGLFFCFPERALDAPLGINGKHPSAGDRKIPEPLRREQKVNSELNQQYRPRQRPVDVQGPNSGSRHFLCQIHLCSTTSCGNSIQPARPFKLVSSRTQRSVYGRRFVNSRETGPGTGFTVNQGWMEGVV